MDFSAAIFDMDGTLIDSLLIWDVLWQDLGKRFLTGAVFRPTKLDDKAIRTMTLKDAMALIHDHYNIGDSAQELLHIANDLIATFYATRVQLKPGVMAFLQKMQESGAKMCIATATAPELIKLAMEHCGLTPFFSRVFSCGDLGKGKDEPDIFLAACKHLRVKPQDTWVFEDSLTAIRTASDLGMKTVAVYDRYNFGQEEMQQIATHYISEGETLLKLL